MQQKVFKNKDKNMEDKTINDHKRKKILIRL